MRKMSAPLVALLTLLQGSLLSCNDISLGQAERRDSFLQSVSLSVDVLFVVDNSLSMQGKGQEQERVQQAFGDFVINLEANKSDFHIGVTTTDLDTDLEFGGTQGRLKEFSLDGMLSVCTRLVDEFADCNQGDDLRCIEKRSCGEDLLCMYHACSGDQESPTWQTVAGSCLTDPLDGSEGKTCDWTLDGDKSNDNYEPRVPVCAEQACIDLLTPYLDDGIRFITNDMPSDAYQGVFNGFVGSLGEGSGWEKGLWAAKLALYPASDAGLADLWNVGFLRDDAKLAVIFVSDEDDCSDEGNPLQGEEQAECYTQANELRPVFEYVADYQMLKEHDEDVLVSAIVGPKGMDNESECGANTSAGTRYINAVDAFGGVIGNICESNFSSILSEMGLSAAGIRTHFVLSRTPNPDSIKVFVNDVEIPSSDGWAYDAVSNAVDFYGDAVPPRNSVIVITYLS